MRIFTHPQLPRQKGDPSRYLEELKSIAKLNEKYNLDGILIFTALDDPFDQWVLAELATRETNQTPIIGLTANMEHPVSVARKIRTFEACYNKQIGINWILGTLLTDHTKIGINLSKEERYRKLNEFSLIVNKLLLGENVNIEGDHFKINNIKFIHPLKKPLLQFVAGLSEGSFELVKNLPSTTHLTSLTDLNTKLPEGIDGISLGIITRPNEQEAIQRFNQLFPENKLGTTYLEMLRKNTDSTNKISLIESALKNNCAQAEQPGFYSSVLKNYVDNGFIVGSYDYVLSVLGDLLNNHINCFIINAYCSDEVEHIGRVFSKLKSN